ncbi:MAG: hypothetical protein KTR33_15840 [Gammaproteobacteria bacterium]|nr:hypothetical protein [Gammaproteobacteria bacterium]
MNRKNEGKQPLAADTPEHKTEQQRLAPLPRSLTYATVFDVRDVEHEITDFMVRKACDEMDRMQQFPFAPRR